MDEAAHNMNNISKLNHVGVTYYTLYRTKNTFLFVNTKAKHTLHVMLHLIWEAAAEFYTCQN